MSHFTASKERSTSVTPHAWLKVGSQMGDLCNHWAKRGDIIAYVGPEAGSGAPACFKPLIAEMEVNTVAAFGDSAKPQYIGDFSDRETQFDYPIAAGAILHEAMHARHSRWPIEDLGKHKNKNEAKLVELFEETRIEARGVEHYPENRSFLRACALHIVIGDVKESDILSGGVMGLSQLMLLTLARVDAGVLEDEDVELIRDKATEYLGKPLLKKLRQLWRTAQAHRSDHLWSPLLKLAKEWIRLLEEAGHDTKPDEVPEELLAMLAEIMGGMPEMADETESEARSEGTIQIVMEIAEEEAKEREAAMRESREHGEAASRVFDKTTGYSGTRTSGSRKIEDRDPQPAERAAAITVAKQFEKARYRDRVTVTRSSAMPPGRLRGGAAVQAAAVRAQGRVPTAEPWRTRRRYHTEDPNLTVGVMVDISGSMGSAMQPMATTAWVMSEAVRRIQGRTAMIYYGSGVFPTLRPGEHLERVSVYTAPDGTERFEEAFKALNGGLNLLDGSGARLLVVVSDFCYTPEETRAAHKWMARCKKDGVAVIVLPFGNAMYAQEVAKDSSNAMRVLSGVSDPAEAAMTIGHEAAQALTQQGQAT